MKALDKLEPGPGNIELVDKPVPRTRAERGSFAGSRRGDLRY